MSRNSTTTSLIVLAVILTGAGYFVSKFITKSPRTDLEKNQNITKQTIKPAAGNSPAKIKPQSPTLPAPAVLSGYKLYKNSEFGFEIQYPSSWTVTEEINENVRGEMVKEFFFRKPGSDLRFAILPRDGLSYGLETVGTSTPAYIGGSLGVQTKYILKDGRRLWLLFPQTGFLDWLQDIGRIDAMTSIVDPTLDTQIFEKMLNSFKFLKY